VFDAADGDTYRATCPFSSGCVGDENVTGRPRHARPPGSISPCVTFVEVSRG
jgi:hypothetical protein